MANTIDFKHFYGTLSSWNSKINSSIWDNAIVFGKVFNKNSGKTNKWEYKIYAGKIYNENIVDSSTLYVYEIATKDQLDDIDASIRAINELINIDSSTFTNALFIEAIQNAVGGSFGDLELRVENLENHQVIVDSSINIIEHSITWIPIEENN